MDRARRHEGQGSSMARRPDALLYAVDETPPLATTLFLGLRQVALMAIYLVMVVIVVRQAGASAQVAQSAVSMGLIAMGISAGLQAIPRGPIGSGYLAPPVISAIYLAPSVIAVKADGLPLVFGMTMVAGLFEAVLSRSGYGPRLARNCTRFWMSSSLSGWAATVIVPSRSDAVFALKPRSNLRR
jgi:xanthine/uracil permease